MNHKLTFLLLSMVLLAGCRRGGDDLLSFVDPFIGTGGHGHTFPGPVVPFGMIQPGPDTRLSGWDGCSGYHYTDSMIYGFSHTHLSGTGVSDYGDILLMPLAGGPLLDNSDAEGYPSLFRKESEEASPGYYRVHLDDEGVTAELTATTRAALHRYTYSDGNEKGVLLDLVHRDMVLDAEIFSVSDTEIAGRRISSAWAREQHIYFVIRFSNPVSELKLFSHDSLVEGVRSLRGRHLKAWAHVPPDAQGSLLVKVGISAVDIEGARKNLEHEIPDWEFDRVFSEAERSWRDKLEKIIVEGGSSQQKKIFYSALYHTYIAPNTWQDVDGRYRGRDNQVHHTEGKHYTVFSLWDTYRTLHPLMTILEPVRTREFLETFLRQYQDGGRLPVWELAANETNCMIGYHSIPVIADAFAKNIFIDDTLGLFEAMVSAAMSKERGLAEYESYGFIPFDKESESVSKTLEYAYDDWCIAQVAGMLGKTEEKDVFLGRSLAYRNLYDPGTGFLRARSLGMWFTPFDPAEVNFHFTEANCWQYTFSVPHDIHGYIDMLGGNEAFTDKLDDLFTASSVTSGREQADITGLIGQYAHGNEPSHHIAYLYALAGKPWKTQEYVSRIMSEFYTTEPDGLIGNEDCGQMSAWYVMSAMGLYPVLPGSPDYVIGSPLFSRITIDLGEDKSFVIEAVKRRKGPYISSARHNKKELETAVISHAEIIEGGTLTFQMSGSATDWGKNTRPQEAIGKPDMVPVPLLCRGDKVFRDSTLVTICCPDPDADIHYTTDILLTADEWPLFVEAFYVSTNTDIWAYAEKSGQRSTWMYVELDKLPEGRQITLNTMYAPQYSAGGDNALIDMITGGEDFRTGAWQGYHGVDLDVMVDLGRSMQMREVRCRFLQDQRSWIFLPEWVEISSSEDGEHSSDLTRIGHDVPDTFENSMIHEFGLALSGHTRYIRIRAKNRGACPPWHPGAGNKAWIFTDEIVIR